MKFRNALVAATMLALPVAAKAQPINGIYVGGAAGVNLMARENASVTTAGGVGGSTSMSSHVGPALDLSIGYGFGNGIRAELEGSYRYNPFYGNNGGVNAGGLEQKAGIMGNVLYDFTTLSPYVQPYIGAGVGYQWTRESNVRISTGGFSGVAATSTPGSFAYQGIVGAAFPIAQAPGLALTADYRFMGLTGTRTLSGTSTSGSARFALSHDYNHTFLVGFRYAFGAPAVVQQAAAQQVAPSPVSRSYIVFFDWDKAVLTDRARQIVAEAAANSTKVQYTRLEVNGYTDTSGTAVYNQGLSVRRAQSVAAELVKDGVPKSAITIQGFGETHPLVPTGNGVREPQNRRVEIIIK